MAVPVKKPNARVSVADYLRREETSEVKHEYHDGEVLERSGGTVEHAAVATNLTISLGLRLRGTDCRLFDSNLKVAVESFNRFVYPEASLLCEPPQFHPQDPRRTTIINPRAIFEVLSDSTERCDRGEKFQRYRMIASLEEYVLLAQDRPVVESFLRQADETWLLQAWQGAEAVARVRCIGVELPLAELYAGVPERPPTPPEGLLKVEVQPQT